MSLALFSLVNKLCLSFLKQFDLVIQTFYRSQCRLVQISWPKIKNTRIRHRNNKKLTINNRTNWTCYVTMSSCTWIELITWKHFSSWKMTCSKMWIFCKHLVLILGGRPSSKKSFTAAIQRIYFANIPSHCIVLTLDPFLMQVSSENTPHLCTSSIQSSLQWHYKWLLYTQWRLVPHYLIGSPLSNSLVHFPTWFGDEWFSPRQPTVPDQLYLFWSSGAKTLIHSYAMIYLFKISKNIFF